MRLLVLQTFKKSMKPKTQEKKEQKSVTFNNAIRPLKGRQKVLNGLESKIFLIEKQAQRKGPTLDLGVRLKILSSKQIP